MTSLRRGQSGKETSDDQTYLQVSQAYLEERRKMSDGFYRLTPTPVKTGESFEMAFASFLVTSRICKILATSQCLSDHLTARLSCLFGISLCSQL